MNREQSHLITVADHKKIVSELEEEKKEHIQDMQDIMEDMCEIVELSSKDQAKFESELNALKESILGIDVDEIVELIKKGKQGMCGFINNYELVDMDESAKAIKQKLQEIIKQSANNAHCKEKLSASHKRVKELEKEGEIYKGISLDDDLYITQLRTENESLKQENKELKEDRDSETRWAKQYRDELYALKEELDRATENNDELINREQELINCYRENIKLDVGEWEKGLKEYKERGVK